MPPPRLDLQPAAIEELLEPAKAADKLHEIVSAKFARLKAAWLLQRQHESSTSKIVMLPPYQSIIGMGPDVVPMLLCELENSPDLWFWALRAITEANPVKPESRGDMNAMARAWVEWGKSQGYYVR
ncbi:MAG: hypothetical protein K2R98_18830 [Gemmataceae bacterium]|nr:hypothetical protein [Gemmataceae bacterium]